MNMHDKKHLMLTGSVVYMGLTAGAVFFEAEAIISMGFLILSTLFLFKALD